MSDRPALEVAKKLNEKIEGFVGYSRSHHDIGLELMQAAQSACTAIEQLSDTVESLQREKEELTRKLGAIDAGHLAKSGGPTMLLLRELDEARAAAITPEMRVRMLHLISESADETGWTTALCEVLDLLGEQG